MLSAGSQTVLPTVGFSPATTVEFIAAANKRPSEPHRAIRINHLTGPGDASDDDAMRDA
jgi:hypothetical protein